jgi:hypothetical protein
LHRVDIACALVMATNGQQTRHLRVAEVRVAEESKSSVNPL